MAIDNYYIKEKAKKDFDSAYMTALVSKLFDTLKGRSNSLLSFQEVLKYVKIKNECYKGMQFVRIDDIIGSQGRYHDFNKSFLPKRRNLRGRWERVDEAHYKDIILPPIKLYQLGKAYFVRDGNHRVSVARRQGREFIDAEVIEIQTDLQVNPGMTKEELIQIITEHEKEVFLENTDLEKHRDVSKLNFSYPGRYDDIISHIQGHQYYLGIERQAEVDLESAMLSWYDNLFTPIIEEIEKSNIASRFPDRTSADLYVWIIRHWDDLKEKYGSHVKISDAVESYKQYGKHPVINFLQGIKNFFKNL